MLMMFKDILRTLIFTLVPGLIFAFLDMDRSGMGFAFMEAFMDEVQVESVPGKSPCQRLKIRL